MLYDHIIDAKEHRRGNQQWIIQRNWQHRVHKTKKYKQKHNTIFVEHHYAQTNTNNRSKTQALLQKTGGKDERTLFYAEIVTGITTRNSESKDT